MAADLPPAPPPALRENRVQRGGRGAVACRPASPPPPRGPRARAADLPPSPTWFPRVSPAAGGGAGGGGGYRYRAVTHEDADGFDEYEIACKLGKGSFAAVFEVTRRGVVGAAPLAAKSYKKAAMARIRVTRARSTSLIPSPAAAAAVMPPSPAPLSPAPPPQPSPSLPSALPRSTPSPIASPGLSPGGGGGGLGTMLDVLHDEIALLRRLRHPHCVATHDVRESASRIWVVMDRLDSPLLKTSTVADASGEGESVRFACPYTRRPLSEPRARQVAAQLFAALQYLHGELRVYHRDIKPDNVMWKRAPAPAPSHPAAVTSDGASPAPDVLSVVVVDFGLAAAVPPGPDAAIAVDAGTPAFAAPETLAGEPYDPFAADVWAAGVTLYACLSGRLPFTAAQGFALATAGDARGAVPTHDGGADSEAGLFTMSAAAALNRAIAAGAYEWPVPLTDAGWDAAALARRLAGGRDVEVGVDGELTADEASPSLPAAGEGVAASPQLVDFLSQALHRDPARRLTAAAALAHPWIAGAAGGGP